MQVTKHTDGNVFWPSMSSDGKTIVYEDNFGIWKLDVASGRTNEIKLDITTDEKDNEHEIETVTNEVDDFDISPSGRRAVISARGQVLTIATDRGDITRINPDKMASRSDSPKWSPDGKYVRLRVGQVRPRRSLDLRSRRQVAEEDHRSRQREGRAGVGAGLEAAALHRGRQEALRLHVADAKTSVLASSERRTHRIGRRLTRQQVGRVLEAGSHAAIACLHRPDRAAAKNATSRTTP